MQRIPVFQGKPQIGVYKFASCDGCQLALLNLGETLLKLAEVVDFVHFPEAGPVAPDAPVDIAFVEGSITTAHDQVRIQQVRAQARFLVTLGACATAGGVQALRNIHASGDWLGAVYARPDYVDSLATSTPIAAHVKVDLELWGCPVNGDQVVGALRALLYGTLPPQDKDKVCLTCKRQQTVCVLVAKGLPCMGPVTRTGCGALCPAFERDCYGCYGPADVVNTTALANRFEGLGLLPEAIARRFLHINNQATAFAREGARQQERTDTAKVTGHD